MTAGRVGRARSLTLRVVAAAAVLGGAALAFEGVTATASALRLLSAEHAVATAMSRQRSDGDVSAALADHLGELSDDHGQPALLALAGRLHMSAAVSGDIGARRDALQDAAVDFTGYLSAHPLAPLEWLRLSASRAALGSPAAAMPAFRRGLASSPFDPALAVPRLGMAFALWPSVDEDTRDALEMSVRHLWADDRNALIALLRRHMDRVDYVRSALADNPDAAARLDARLARED